jgi:hypothetical protein
MLPILSPSHHQISTTQNFAAWYVFRSNSGAHPGTIRDASIFVWAGSNDIDVSEEGVTYIFEHWQDLVERFPN